MDDAPAALGPLEVPRAACLSLEAPLEGGREFSKPRHAMIAATPVLRERELAKMAALADALASALSRRGVAAQQASLAARAGVAALKPATSSWYEDPSRSVRALIDQALHDLLGLSAATNR